MVEQAKGHQAQNPVSHSDSPTVSYNQDRNAD